VTEQYETLRAAAGGDQLPLEARSGLALFLRRGMWAWARGAATPSATSKPARSFLPSSTAINDEQRAVVRLFAAIAMKSLNNPRTHERIAQSPVASPRA
jgi:hypothetical protein